MSIFKKIFKSKELKKENIILPTSSNNLECQNLLDFYNFISELLNSNAYIPRSSFVSKLATYKRTFEYFHILKDSGTLGGFCKENHFPLKSVTKIIELYQNLEDTIEKHNDDYVNAKLLDEKEYLDNILKAVDPKIVLDLDQRKAVLTEEDYCLIIAGAGAGKTTTVAAKVKYLVDKKGIDPLEILVLSFTNKAVNELKERVNRDLNIACPITTFHSTGNALLRKQYPEKLNIVDSNKIYYVLQDYFKNSVLKDERLVDEIILFFSSYLEAPYEGVDIKEFFKKIANSNNSTMKSDIENYQKEIIDQRTKRSVTILNEVLRSKQEVEIANFLYLNNLDYEYEPIYRYGIELARKPYTPDFLIKQGELSVYLEHFGITQKGENDKYSNDQLAHYKNAINNKIKLHKKHGTKLIYTFSAYNDKRSLKEHLEDELIKAGFNLTARCNKEVLEKIIESEENRYIRKLLNLICRFINNFKTNGFTSSEFDKMYHSTNNVRNKLFLNICHSCYLEYENYLKKNEAIDFEDMINESARILKEIKEMKEKLDFKYVIVDEYQDISQQRFDMVGALAAVTDAKIIAVGDDWQSIYRFSGSRVELFTDFSKKMGYAKVLKIVKTYRNSQEVIDIAGNFIQKNEHQITKELESNKNIKEPVIIYTYDGRAKEVNGNRRSGRNYELGFAIQKALEQIIEFNKQENKPYDSSILLLGRYGFDGDKLEKSGLFEFDSRSNKIRSVKHPRLNITFMTAHASKGLGYDNVIIINGRNETYGFPSKIEDDPVLNFVIKLDLDFEYAEERRLFYVAMTRTKNRVFCIAPKDNPSEFLLEIKNDYQNVILRGDWDENTEFISSVGKYCPICGYPLQYRYKNSFGLRLYICSNEPEICGFMTNEYSGGKLSIMKCDKCRDGYLVVKANKNKEYFLGCTNYLADGSGCNNIISKTTFFTENKLTEESVEPMILKKGYKKEPRIIKEVKEENNTTILTKDNDFHNIIKHESLKRKTYNEDDLGEIIYNILQALEYVSYDRYFGIEVLVDVLRGAKSKKLKTHKLNKLKCYGSYSSVNRDELKAIVQWLIANNFILKTKNNYPVLHPTYKGRHYKDELTNKMLENLQKTLTALDN